MRACTDAPTSLMYTFLPGPTYLLLDLLALDLELVPRLDPRFFELDPVPLANANLSAPRLPLLL